MQSLLLATSLVANSAVAAKAVYSCHVKHEQLKMLRAADKVVDVIVLLPSGDGSDPEPSGDHRPSGLGAA